MVKGQVNLYQRRATNWRWKKWEHLKVMADKLPTENNMEIELFIRVIFLESI